MIKKRLRLGELLIKEALITEDDLKRALEYQKKLQQNGEFKKLGEVLIELGLVREKEILEILSRQLNLPFIDLYGIKIDYDYLMLYPLNYLEEKKIFPFKEDEDYVYIAAADPLDYEPIERIERLRGKLAQVYIALSKDIDVVLERVKVYISLQELIKKALDELEKGSGENISAIDELLELILSNAISQRATDLHIEPQKYNFIIRGRVDGVLKEFFSLDKEIYPPIVSKIKLFSGMDISEKRKPQDGRFSKIINNKEYDFRTSVVPTIYGENIVLRILDKSKILLRVSELGMSEYNFYRYEQLIKIPYGIIFVTGPTGSGKTTTLYASLNEVKGVEKKIITIEDPVEYELPLIQQIQVYPKIGLDFATVLRSVLRQDPDIIMIGEVRDEETLESAMKAALTGHLVLATLHTNDAISAITRMTNMGAEPYMISDSLLGVVAQRLIRKICPHCKDIYYPTKDEKEKIKNFLKEEITFYKGKGCKNCNFTGYLGREIVSEVFIVNDKISHLIALGKDKHELLNVAKEFGFITLVEDAINKLKEGKTTIEEILRIVRLNVL